MIGFAAGQGIPEVKVNRLLLNNIDVRGVGWGGFAMSRTGYMHQQWEALLGEMRRAADDAGKAVTRRVSRAQPQRNSGRSRWSA